MSEVYLHAARATLTPRQDRIERTLVRLLAGDAPRSQLRELVYEYADLHRLQGSTSDRALGMLQEIVTRASPRTPDLGSAAGDAGDTMAMIVRWYVRRFAGGRIGVVLSDAPINRERAR
ncbi:MAG: hypothetical protein ABIP93_16165 [Gemmatimonadaceae bacterium]